MAASAVSTNRLFVFLSSLSGTRRNVIPTLKAMSGIGNISGPTPPFSRTGSRLKDKQNKKKTWADYPSWSCIVGNFINAASNEEVKARHLLK